MNPSTEALLIWRCLGTDSNFAKVATHKNRSGREANQTAKFSALLEYYAIIVEQAREKGCIVIKPQPHQLPIDDFLLAYIFPGKAFFFLMYSGLAR